MTVLGESAVTGKRELSYRASRGVRELLFRLLPLSVIGVEDAHSRNRDLLGVDRAYCNLRFTAAAGRSFQQQILFGHSLSVGPCVCFLRRRGI